jgi:hypothetical protein
VLCRVFEKEVVEFSNCNKCRDEVGNVFLDMDLAKPRSMRCAFAGQSMIWNVRLFPQ